MPILAMSLTNDTLTVVVNDPSGTIRTVPVRKDDARWLSLMDAYKKGDEALVEQLLSLKAVVEKYSYGDISISDAGVTYKGVPLYTLDVQRIMAFLRDGIPYERYAKFVARKMKNPSARAINEMYNFLENMYMPLTANGTFIAYKAVQNDFYSITGNKETVVIQGVVNEEGQILNRVGDTIEIERSSCDDNYQNCCSFGLHAGSLQYAQGFGPKIILVEIDPADVVSVPDEGTFHKLRCCKYKVVGEYNGPLPQHHTNEFSSTPEEECVGEECPDCHGHDCCCESDECDGYDDCGCDNCCSNGEDDTPSNQDGEGDFWDSSDIRQNELEKVAESAGVFDRDNTYYNDYVSGLNAGDRAFIYNIPPQYIEGDQFGADSDRHHQYIQGYIDGYNKKSLPNKEG